MSSSNIPQAQATRRKLLAWGGLGGLGGLAAYLGWIRSSSVPQGALPVQAVQSAPRPEVMPAESGPAEAPAAAPATPFNREAFLPHVNSDFTMVCQGQDSGICKLVDVSAASQIVSPKQSYTSFTLLFEADFLFLREGGLCSVKHAQMPEMQFFLSPVGRPGRKVLLEAVFTQAV